MRQFKGKPKRLMRRPVQRRDVAPDSGEAGRGWQHVAGWYSKHLAQGDTHQATLIFPNAIKLLEPRRGATYLDVACGDGSFAASITKAKAKVVGVDAASALVEVAKRRRLVGAEFFVGDARHLPGPLAGRKFAGATCLMAIQNIPEMSAVFAGVAELLEPDAPFVIVTNHPAFRIPRQSEWGFDEAKKLMYRRVDRYLTMLDVPILMNPGSRGEKPVTTTTYHRPISAYVGALAAAGFVVDGLEEWTSQRMSDSGPRAKAENRAREEFPLFLAIRARRVG